MKKTNTTTFYSLAVAAAGLLMVFAAGCSGDDGGGSCGDTISVQGQGELPTCSSDSDCSGNTTCTPLDNSNCKVCFGGDDPDPDPDTSTDTSELPDTGKDSGPEEDAGENSGMEDVKTDGGGGGRPRSELSCLESYQCQLRKCFRPGAGSNCQANQQRAMFGAAQTDFTALVQCIGQDGTCSNACPGDNCESCIDNNCSSRIEYCFGEREPRNYETCGDATACIAFCSQQTETQSQLQQCVGNTCPSLFSQGSPQATKRIEYVECLNANLGFGRGENEGPDAGIGTNDAGMPVSTCSTQADANGNNNAQVDTEAESDAEADCLWEACGTEITNCFGCK